MGKCKPVMKTCQKCGETKELRAGFRENRKDKTWPDLCRDCEPRRGETAKASANYAKARKGMRVENVPCHGGCRETISVTLEEGTKAPPMFCSRCKEYGPPEERAPIVYRDFMRVLGVANFETEPVRVLRPGEADFSIIASQCRHIAQIRVAGSLTAPGEPSTSRLIV